MQILVQISQYLTFIGGLIIGILLYYHKQTPAVWVTFFTIMSLTLSLCLRWQQSIVGDNNSAKNEDLQNSSTQKLTLLYLFKNDFNNLLRATGDIVLTDEKGDTIKIKSQLYLDFESQNEFIGFFIHNTPETFNICIHLAENFKTALEIKDKIKVEGGAPGLQPVNADELKFSGRIFIYHEYPLFEEQKRKLYRFYEKHDLSPQFRGTDYLFEKKKIQNTR